jgi:CxxC motif-containing protein (DUF1111 family)
MISRGSDLRFVRLILVLAAVVLVTIGYWAISATPTSIASAQNGLGSPLPNLSSLENTMFTQGQFPFNKQWDFVQGLGPVFTQIGCEFCHIDPVLGGNSSNKNTFFGTITNGVFDPLTNEGGPLLQKMSIEMFRSNCKLKGEVVPSDATIVARHQTPQTFGLGLIDNIPDSQILANATNKGMGVFGVANIVSDYDGTQRVGRFGLKSQFASLLQAATEAEGHDLSVTTPIVPDEDLPQGLPIPQNCSITQEPNDPSKQMMAMYHFLLYMAPAAPGDCSSDDCKTGQTQFKAVGCGLCHIPPGSPGTYTTNTDVIVPVEWQGRIIHSKALSNKPVPLYSDLLLHKMGSALADGLPEGLATGAMFRTTPLWGFNSRNTSKNGLLHDGRTTDPIAAILAHGGEATQSINKFKALTPTQQGNIVTFLNTL